jgi:radical SAM superfamily enzyme YgiQ (UPF0313 family)
MFRVALINLPFQGGVASVAQTSLGPPMGLAYLAAVLERAGHDLLLLDANVLGLPFSEVTRRLAAFRPHVVGTTAATPSIGLAARFSAAVREAVPGRPAVVVGGPHGTVLPEQTLAAFPDVDVVVIGEGEGIADRLVRALAEGGSLEEVPSVAFRPAGERPARIRVTGPARPESDLDSLPSPARHLLPNHLYRTIDAWPMTCMVAMRGCPAGCIYCNVPGLAGRAVRRRSPANVVAEMEEVLSKYGVRFFSFLDDTFTTSREWTLRFCDALAGAGLGRKVSWSCLTRPDMADEELLARMKACGLTRVEFGIESGSPRVLAFLEKGAKLETIRRAFSAARKLGLVTLGFAMINTPEESPAEMEMTLAEALEIDPDFLQLSFCTPYPGTRLHEYCVGNGLLTSADWSDYRFLKEPIIRNRYLTGEEVAAWHGRILRRFYLRPGKALRLARLAASRPDSARSLLRTSLHGMKELVYKTIRPKGSGSSPAAAQRTDG